MPTLPLPVKVLQAAIDAYSLNGYKLQNTADAMKLPRTTLQNRIKSAKLLGLKSIVKPKSAVKEEPVERLNTDVRHAQLSNLPRSSVRRYLVTSAQNATPIHSAFFASLLIYCKENKAELVVIPYRYQNPTSVWSDEAKSKEWWAKETIPYLLNKRIFIGKGLMIVADIMIQPTATRPLSGFDTITGSSSAIFAHPRIELVTVPTPQHKLPKILTTTGVCTKPNYTDSKAGKKGQFHHTFGACLVEVDGDTFHIRQINACDNGSFMDLNYEYSKEGKKKVNQIEALIMGDTHQEFIDPAVTHATFKNGGIVPTLQPKHVVWHDMWDGYARNHHHEFEAFINYVKHHAVTDDVEMSLDKAFKFVDDNTPPDVTNVFVPSNHPDVLAKWVKRADWRTDPRNAKFLLKTTLAMLESAEMGKSGTKTIDPFVYWAKLKLKCANQTKFLKRDESFRVKGIELCYHGDIGSGGARGSAQGFNKIGTKSIIGHSHSPKIIEGVYQVGTSSFYTLEYNSGPSSWLQTHCIIYSNGKRSLINIINGKWRA